ncbi:hypothetical protein Tco_1133743 [Tanacetum coccineum]
MFLYMDQLQKQLDNEEFQDIGSMSAYKVLETQFQMFIKSRFYLDDEYVDMIRNKFLQYTRLAIPEFRDTPDPTHRICKKVRIGERTQHKTEIIRGRDTSSRSGNDAHVDDADIRPIYAEEPMAEVQMTADDNVSATGQQHTEQPEFNNEGKSNENADVLAQIQKKGFAIAALKNELRKLTGNSVNTKPRISKPRFASQVDVNNDLSKPVTTHHLPKGRESAPAKPHHMIAPSSSRYSLSTGLVPQGQKASDYDNSNPVPPRQNVIPTAEKIDSSQQGKPLTKNGRTKRLHHRHPKEFRAAYEWFTKECIGSITTWDNMLEKFIFKFHHLSDHNEEETEEDDNRNETDNIPEILRIEGNLFNFETFLTKWPTCTSDIDGFCNGGELPGMVRVGSMTYFQDHKWYDELADRKLKDETLALKTKIEGSWGDATLGVLKF